jgi:hypothetical protein
MTSRRVQLSAAAAATAAVLGAAHIAHRHDLHEARATRSPSVRPAIAPTEKLATAFVQAVTRVDRSHPHGDLAALHAVCTSALYDQLRSVDAMPAAALQDGGSQSGTVISIAAGHIGAHQVVLAVAELIENRPPQPTLRTVTTYTLRLEWAVDGWRVAEVTT